MEIDFQKKLVLFYFTVYKSKILRNDLIKNESSQRRLDGS